MIEIGSDMQLFSQKNRNNVADGVTSMTTYVAAEGITLTLNTEV